MFIHFVAIVISSFSLSLAYIMMSRRLSIVDMPNSRSSHVVPTPRGVGIIVVVFYAFFAPGDLLIFLLPVVFGLIGFLDDFQSLSSAIRFFLYGFLLNGFWLFTFVYELNNTDLINAIFCFLILWFLSLWWVNLYNFMDGINGLAIGQAIFGLLSIYLLAESSEHNELIIFMIAALLGVLLWNFPKARVFLGDSGSLFLAALLLLMAVITKMPFLVFVILMAVFIADSTYTLIVRLFSGKNIFSAHRDHAYQKLAMRYQSHTKVTLACVVYNFLYLLPIAFFVFNKSLLIQMVGVLFSYLPLLLVVYEVKAGFPLKRLRE